MSPGCSMPPRFLPDRELGRLGSEALQLIAAAKDVCNPSRVLKIPLHRFTKTRAMILATLFRRQDGFGGRREDEEVF